MVSLSSEPLAFATATDLDAWLAGLHDPEADLTPSLTRLSPPD